MEAGAREILLYSERHAVEVTLLRAAVAHPTNCGSGGLLQEYPTVLSPLGVQALSLVLDPVYASPVRIVADPGCLLARARRFPAKWRHSRLNGGLREAATRAMALTGRIGWFQSINDNRLLYYNNSLS